MKPQRCSGGLASEIEPPLIVATVNEVIAKGGRNDEVDLHNAAGGYQRLMDKNAAGHPCPKCGTKVEKMQYLGGACYFCTSCQS